MPRYVILTHDHPTPHWDFMLEAGETLRAWRLQAVPQAGIEIPAVASFEHRAIYLEYEGPISGGRGRVTRWDAGVFEWMADTTERVEVLLSDGVHCRGQVRLQRIQAENWLFYLAVED